MPSEIRERLGFIPVMDTSPGTLHLNKQMHDDALDFDSVAEDKRKRAIATSAVLGLGILSGLYAKSKVPMEVIEKHTLPVISSLVGSAGQMAAGYGAVGLMQKDKSKEELLKYLAGIGLGTCLAYRYAFKPSAPFVPNKANIAGTIAPALIYGAMHFIAKDRVDKNNAMERALPPTKYLVPRVLKKYFDDNGGAEKTAYHPAEDYSGADRIKHASANRYAELVRFVRKSKNAGKNVFTTEAQREMEEANKKVKKDNQDIAFRKGIAAGASAAEKVMSEGKKKAVKSKKKPALKKKASLFDFLYYEK